MGRIVLIAEKPSVAREIARVLGCKGKQEGYLEGDGYIVTWALGHLIGQVEPEQLDEKYAKWREDTLPILPQEIPLKIIRGRKKQFDLIKKLINAKETDSLICATDAGREGELIFRWIYAYAKCKKPVQRLWISSMTDEAIRKGLSEMKSDDAYEGLFRSAKSRAWADWIVGMNATRAYTIRYGTLLSIGRVQTPTLAFLVKRQKEIDAFVPQDYWVITADFGDYTGEWRDPETGKTQTSDPELAKRIVARDKGKTGTVIQAQKERKSQNPPLLYDLTELQRDCNRAFGFTAKKTLGIAQDLYEKRKLITYPRTDSRFLTADVARTLRSVLGKVQVPELKEEISLLQEKEKWNLRRVINDKRVSDHHAIIPTGNRTDFSRLSADEQKVYDRIVRRLIASLSDPWVYDDVTIVTQIRAEEASDDYLTRGKTTVEEGWKRLYRKEKDAEKENLLPKVREGELREAVSVTSKKKATKPPQQYTEATLLSAMEHAGRQIEDEDLREQMKECGLGTPATRAAIIERILQTGYAKRSGRALIAQPKGIQLIGILPEMMTSAVMTGNWEAELARMASENDDPSRMQTFSDSITDFTRQIVQSAFHDKTDAAFEKTPPKSKGSAPRQAPVALGSCPMCKEGSVMENSKAFYCSRWKEGCKLTWWKNGLKRTGGPILTERIVKELLEKGSVRGRTGTIVMGQDKSLSFEKKEEKSQ